MARRSDEAARGLVLLVVLEELLLLALPLFELLEVFLTFGAFAGFLLALGSAFRESLC